MKKIIISMGTIVAVMAIAIGGTMAFFSDTETSTGNMFTAGSIDLKVNQTLASYNGENCINCHLTIVSDETTKVGTTAAVVLTNVHSAWTADLDGGHSAGMPNDGSNDGSKWVWITDGPIGPENDQTYTFTREFEWNGSADEATLYIATDNLYSGVVLNGTVIGSTTNPNNFTLETEDVFSGLAEHLIQGTNTLEVTVTNIGVSGSTPAGNPAGLLFKLVIGGDCKYQDTPDATCQLWGSRDIDKERFFEFGDVKPGDRGVNVISLEATYNDAFVCVIPHNTVDLENTLVEPEVTLGDDSSKGELSDYLQFFLWEDSNGDGSYQTSENTLVNSGTGIAEIQTAMNVLEITGGGATEYIGLAWCAGTQTVNTVDTTNHTITCDGSTMGDMVQTDSLTADITIYSEQVRNNPNFNCNDIVM